MKYIVFVLLICTSFTVKGQFLHIGLKGMEYPMVLLESSLEEGVKKTFYLTNEKNETLIFTGIEEGAENDWIPKPSLYLRYENKNHLYYQAEVGYLWFENNYLVENTVDASEFIGIPNYNNYINSFKFITTSYTVGYKFRKTKILRPAIQAGFGMWYLMDFAPAGYSLEDIDTRHTVFLAQMDTFEPITYFGTLRACFHYYALTVNFQIDFSILDVDKRNGALPTVDDKRTSNYESLQTFGLGVSYNLASFNTTRSSRKTKPSVY